MANDNNIEGLSNYLASLHVEHGILHDSISRVETKANGLLAASVAILAILPVVSEILPSSGFISSAYAFFVLMQVATICFAWSTVGSSTYQTSVRYERNRAFSDFTKKAGYDMTFQLLVDSAATLKTNMKQLSKKSMRYRIASLLFISSVLPLLAVSAYVMVYMK
jgi:ABC-type transport system involved in Fe-S cluster assembly fused permease/ATPase subunit